MQKLSFWRRTDDYHQGKAINEAVEELGGLQWQTGQIGRDVLILRNKVAEQRLEIAQLKAALQAVCDLLVDLDLVEEQALAYRVDSAIAEAEPPPEPAAHTPFSGASGGVVQRAAEEQCARCKRTVPAAEISFTDHGRLCDECLAWHNAGGQ